MNRTANQWYTAFPPYHNCGEGIGPADYFGKTLLDSISEDITIGFIPCALSGVDIAFFQKNVVSSRRNEFQIPPDNHWAGAYPWMLERCRLAQEAGVIKGILFHQGESDNGQQAWVDKVAGIIRDLKTDLGLSDQVPVIAGELLYTGCCAVHNALVNQLPSKIPNCRVASARDLQGRDQYHFNLESERVFGKRYAGEFLKLSDSQWVPRKGQTSISKPVPSRIVSFVRGRVEVYSLNGKIKLSTGGSGKDALRSLKKNGVYIFRIKSSGDYDRSLIVPVVN